MKSILLSLLLMGIFEYSNGQYSSYLPGASSASNAINVNQTSFFNFKDAPTNTGMSNFSYVWTNNVVWFKITPTSPGLLTFKLTNINTDAYSWIIYTGSCDGNRIDNTGGYNYSGLTNSFLQNNLQPMNSPSIDCSYEPTRDALQSMVGSTYVNTNFVYYLAINYPGPSDQNCPNYPLAGHGFTLDFAGTTAGFVNFPSRTSTICSGSSTTLTASGAGTGATYSWTKSDGTPATGLNTNTGASVIASPSQTTIYTVTATTPGGCVVSQNTTVTVNPLPTAPTLTATSPTTLCQGGTVGYTATQIAGLTYNWAFPTGSSQGGGSNVNGNISGNRIMGASSGNIALTVTNNGCSTTSTIPVTVNPKPALTFSVTPTTVCEASTVSVNASFPTANLTYITRPIGTSILGGNNTGTALNGTDQVGSTSGNYVVTITDNNGCTNSKTIPITVNIKPTLTFSVTPTTVCEASAVSLNASFSAASFSINQPTGTTMIGANSSATSYTGTDQIGANSGNYIFTVTDNKGCTNSKTVHITVNPLPTVAPITGNFTTDMCGTTQLANVTTGGVWSSSNTAFATVSSTGLVTPVSAGNATINYTVTNGTCSNLATATITVNSQYFVVPDPYFYAYLKNKYPTCFELVGGVDKLNICKAANAVGNQIYINSPQITSVEGIQYFNPKSIIIQGNNLISYLPKLTGNNIGELFVLQCSNFVGFNGLPPALISFDCSYNRLQTLPNLPNTLTYFSCYNNCIPVALLPARPVTISASSWITTPQNTTCTARLGHIEETEVDALVYPNPANDILNVNQEGTKVIYSTMGVEVIRTEENTINVSNLASGLYVVQIVNENTTSKTTFVKQ